MKVDTKRGCTMLNMFLRANPAQFSFSVYNLQYNLLRHYVQVKGSFGTREFVACYNSQSFLNNLPYKVLFVFVWEMGPPQQNHLCNSMVIYSFQIDLFNSSCVKSYSFFFYIEWICQIWACTKRWYLCRLRETEKYCDYRNTAIFHPWSSSFKKKQKQNFPLLWLRENDLNTCRQGLNLKITLTVQYVCFFNIRQCLHTCSLYNVVSL